MAAPLLFPVSMPSDSEGVGPASWRFGFEALGDEERLWLSSRRGAFGRLDPLWRVGPSCDLIDGDGVEVAAGPWPPPLADIAAAMVVAGYPGWFRLGGSVVVSSGGWRVLSLGPGDCLVLHPLPLSDLLGGVGWATDGYPCRVSPEPVRGPL